ncbi:MAG: TlpA family protein disulfide reductase [Bacteroidales bacterium]
MHKLFLVFIGFFLLSSGLRSQNSGISGNAIGAEGLKIKLITSSDYISELPVKLDETTVDSLGKFKLKTSINECIYAQIQIDIYKGAIYLEPGKNYSITINPLNYKDDDIESPFLNKKKLEIIFNNPDSIEINQQISKFNSLFEGFLMGNSNIIFRSRNKAKIDSFQLKMNILFSISKNQFLTNYIKYSFADLEQSARIKSSAKLFESYFMNQPVYYNNVEYMYFFNQFYEKFLTNSKFALHTNVMKRLINERNYISLLDSMGRDSTVKNEVIRELVFLKGMKDLYYSNAYNNDNIIDILTSYSRKTKFKEHKLISQNLIVSFNKLKPGNKAPDFKLKTVTDEVFTLASFEGKYTYIGFFTTWCAGCKDENEAIIDLKKKFGDKINFVSISADKQVLNLHYYLDKHKYDWYFLHYANNTELLEKYEIHSYPVFILLDQKGNIMKIPALKPSEDIETEFKILLEKKDTLLRE